MQIGASDDPFIAVAVDCIAHLARRAGRVAAQAGYTHVGLRLNPVLDTDPRIMEDLALRDDLRAALPANGINVLDIDVFRIEATTNVNGMHRAIEFGASLGARYLVCTLGPAGPWQPGEEVRTASKLAELAHLCASFGVQPMLEFIPFRKLGTLAGAQHILELAGHPNLGVCVDSLHLARSQGTPADVASLPQALPYIQLCDGLALAPADLAFEARFERLIPGDGELPLVDLIRALPQGFALSIEVPSRQRAAWSPLRRALAALEGTRKVLDASQFEETPPETKA